MKHIFKTEEQAEVKGPRAQYTLKEAAFLLNTSVNTIKKWFAGQTYKIDGVGFNFISHQDIEDFVEERKVMDNFLEAAKNG